MATPKGFPFFFLGECCITKPRRSRVRPCPHRPKSRALPLSGHALPAAQITQKNNGPKRHRSSNHQWNQNFTPVVSFKPFLWIFWWFKIPWNGTANGMCTRTDTMQHAASDYPFARFWTRPTQWFEATMLKRMRQSMQHAYVFSEPQDKQFYN